jgi:imidazolonepropionase-like amidohydrolase
MTRGRLATQLSLLAGLGAAGTASVSAQAFVLAGGNVIDVRTGVSSVLDVLVSDGVIRRLGPPGSFVHDLEEIDARGMWVVPGLIELHTHTTDSIALRRALGLGVTSTLTIRTPPDEGSLEALSSLPEVPLPREHTVAGRFTGGFPRLDVGRWAPTSRTEAGFYLDELRRMGYGRIKIWMDDFSLQRSETVPVLSDSVFQALLAGATARGMRSYVHALEGPWYRAAIAGGASWVIHPMFPDSLTRADAAALVAQGMGWTTVLSVVLRLGDAREYARLALADPRLVATMSEGVRRSLESTAALRENPGTTARPRMVEKHREYLDVIVQNARRAVSEGVVLSVGSDSQAGFGTHVEIELLRDYGFDAWTILRALTLGGATGLGVASHFGSIELGRVADLVVLGADPLEDITNLRDVHLVVKGGHVWLAEDLRR